jgi:hypothetical protein
MFLGLAMLQSGLVRIPGVGLKPGGRMTAGLGHGIAKVV